MFIGAVRLVAFVAAALGIELGRGAGVATLLVSVLIGALRWHPALLVAATLCGVAFSLSLPDTNSQSKVLHGLSNAPFVVLLYLLLAGIGYGGGRLFRALRRT